MLYFSSLTCTYLQILPPFFLSFFFLIAIFPPRLSMLYLLLHYVTYKNVLAYPIVLSVLQVLSVPLSRSVSHLISHLFLNCEGRWGTTDDFTSGFLHFPCSQLPSETWPTPGLSIP